MHVDTRRKEIDMMREDTNVSRELTQAQARLDVAIRRGVDAYEIQRLEANVRRITRREKKSRDNWR